MNKIYVIVPVFNEGEVIIEVIKEIRKAGYKNIVVVDDGSADNTYEKAKRANVVVLRHKINRGKGAAVKTGLEAAKIMGAEIVVTMDGDGQHNPRDLGSLIKKIKEGYEVALGARTKNRELMQFWKRAANFAANIFTWYLNGIWVTDSQSGMRAYSKKALNLIDTKSDRYAYDSEIIREIYRHKLKFIEIPIEVRYTRYSMGKAEKQGFLNGLKTVARMVWNILS